MNLTFRVRFVTQPGQSLALAGGHPLPAHPVPLRFFDRDHWQVTIPITAQARATSFNYSYIFRNDAAQATDWGRDRSLCPADFRCAELLVIDSWNSAAFHANAFATAPFKNVLLAENFTEVKTAPAKSPTHTFRVKAPLLGKNQTLCLIGEGAVLGDWQTANPVLLSRIAGKDDLSVQLDLRGQPFPFTYKYGVFDIETKSFIRFEDGDNRILNDKIERDKYTLVNDGFAGLPVEHWRGAGVAVPVFSLRSENSFGTGEFLDLKPLADWGKQAGLKLIQLLPVNDTSATNSWKDSCPYAAISAFALHPLYLNLAAVTDGKNRKHLKPLEALRQRLNRMKMLDYEAVMKAKLGFLKKIFPSQKATAFGTKEYKKFFAENRGWLVPYAAFCCLRDKFGTADFSQWPEHKTFDAKKIAALAKKNEEIAFHYFVQFHLRRQLKEATAHAHACGLVVKGDIAIGVHQHGVDAWQSPELFRMEMQAGASPDAYAWWKRRLMQMGNYFDAFRIDHIPGFFRIGSNPAHALKRVTNMLICGEDPGPGFLSLEIQRMPKNPGQDFSRPAEAPYLSVVTPSNHDMSTIRGWWTEDRALTQKFFNLGLGLPGEAPHEATPEMVEAVVRQHLASPAMWSIFQLQDLLGLDGGIRRKDAAAERINVPAIPNFFWRHRLHLTLEKLSRAKDFNSRLHGLLVENAR